MANSLPKSLLAGEVLNPLVTGQLQASFALPKILKTSILWVLKGSLSKFLVN